MAGQRIIWTALPHGTDGNNLKLSVFVSPRLVPGAVRTLDQFPDFWNPAQGHWPAKARSLEFFAEIDGNPNLIPAQRLEKGSYNVPYFDKGLWEGLFTAKTPVAPFEYADFRTRVIRSFPMRGVLGTLQDLYTAVAVGNPDEHPNLLRDPILVKIRNMLGLINYGEQNILTRSLRRPPDLDPELKKSRVLDYKGYNAYGHESFEQLSFYQASRFYDRPEFQEAYRERPELSAVPHRLKKPDIDFHQILAALGDYPELMRRLGLVVELLVPKPAVAFSKIRVRLKAGGKGFSDNDAVFPWTWCTKDGSFRPLARPGTDDIRDGMLAMAGATDRITLKNPSKYDVVTVDADGSAMKTVDFSANLFRMAAPRDRSYVTPEGAALPALRSGGIGIVKFNRAAALSAHFGVAALRNSAAAMAAPGTIELYADDLVRGYRIDVDDGGTWHSLCRRDGTYQFTAGAKPTVTIEDEEGYVKGASTSSKDGASSDLYFHEMMFRWDGWSICAKRPGKTIAPQAYNADGSPKQVQGEVVSADPAEGESLPPGVNLKTSFKARPGTLPRLRFGNTYRLRARVVDLAGNSEPHTSADDSQATNKVLYTRYEPVNPPALVLRAPITEGESVEHMVIRSNFDASAKDYAGALNTKTGLTIYTEANERHVVAPKTSQLNAETHGMLDEYMKGGPGGVERAYNISKREFGTFFDRAVVDIASGELAPLPDPSVVQLVTPPVVKAKPPYPTLRGDPENFGPQWNINPLDPQAPSIAAGQYLIRREENIPIPYLPDPVSQGVAFRGLPNGGSNAIVLVDFRGLWPKVQGFRIKIVEYPGVSYCDGKNDIGKQEWNPETRVLTVYLAKGEVARVRYSSTMKEEDLGKMGIVQWIRAINRYDQVKGYLVRGQHWMVTPYRELTLVHAVQQPLCEPTIKAMIGAKKTLGQTHADIRAKTFLSVRSTGKIELLAEWDEPVDFVTEPVPRDNPSNPDYKPSHGQAHVLELRIEDSYPDELSLPLQVPEPGGDEKKLVIVNPEIYRHEFGDTKHRKVNYHLLGTTRFREYFPQTVISDPANLTRAGQPYTVSVPSSARPDAPKILYVIPTFGWDPPQQIGNDIVSRRCGGGLRVYMDRPWYSSGEGEMLGVVVVASSTFEKTGTMQMFGGGVTDLLKPYVTQWGSDPIWGSEPLGQGPGLGDFTLATNPENGKVTGLSLDEIRDASGNSVPVVAVAPHLVEYDPERKLWFCDIVLDSGTTYYPFIRLALARYQPNSIPDAHLSRVVLADFAQLAPDRVAAVTFVSETKIRVMISGTHGINTFTKGEGFNPADKNTFKNLRYSRRLSASLESPIQGFDKDVVQAMGWGPVSTALTDIELVPFQQYDARMVWMAEITLPEKPKRYGGKAFRVVIKEYERLEADAEVATVGIKNEREKQLLQEGKTDKDGMAVFLNDAIERLVYADTIEI